MSFFKKIFKYKKVSNSDIQGSKDFKKIVNNGIYSCLKNYGFRRRANNFEKKNSDLNYHIQIQSSLSSNSKLVKLTLNLGIVSTELINKENKDSFGIHDSHWRQRIGYFRDEQNDYWWSIDSTKNAEKATEEIVDLIDKRVIPYWDKIRTTYDLKKRWESGVYSGLTEGQLKYYLELLKE